MQEFIQNQPSRPRGAAIPTEARTACPYESLGSERERKSVEEYCTGDGIPRCALGFARTGRPRSGEPLILGLAVIFLLFSPAAGRASGGTNIDAAGIDWNKAQEFWAFQAPRAQATPAVTNRRWARQRVDYFVLSGLESRRLAPSPEADKAVLLRRVTFDLTGLPPTPGELRDFLADSRPGAYERVVERLLAAPAFGERMASLWMNVARYAEDQAHQVGDDVKSFYPNAWRYREWVIDAFNRDLPYDAFIRLQLAADKGSTRGTNDLAALGFIGLGPKYYNRDRLDVMADEWEDRVDTVSRAFLGLTIACARCHDHKYDPVTTQDYYAMAGIFASTRLVNKTLDGKTIEPPKKQDDGAAKKEAPKPAPAALHVVDDDTVRDLNVFVRGNVDRKGPVVERRFLRILCKGEPRAFTSGSGREELAEAIASRDNPLTARVMVNRVWALCFGHGLVGTPSNFGSQGQRPTHPELLDDLAVRFMENRWSLKKLVEELVLSATYRQQSHLDARTQLSDPDNQWLSRMNRRRLPIEMWRDSVLAVSGDLQGGGGPSLELDDPQNRQRTVYARISRLKLNDLLMQFDYPDANVHAEKRSVTTTASQKLFLLNSPFMLGEAHALAGRLTAGPKASNRSRIESAYRLLYGRAPGSVEMQLGLAFLARPNTAGLSQWDQYAQTLLAANEMMYVD